MNHRVPDHQLAVCRVGHPAEPASPDPTDSQDGIRRRPSGQERLPGGRYGTAEVSVSGVDRSQLRRNLQLTPTERVERMVALVHAVLPLKGALRQPR
jgi:hypothetical protein